MNDLIDRQAAIDLIKNDAFWVQYAWGGRGHKPEMEMVDDLVESIIKQMKESVMSRLKQMPSAQPEIIRCHQCGFWDRETLRHQHNDFRDWNEAECMMLAERDGYNEISHYVEADDYCSYAERRTDGSD